jgi:hypothetical protein
MDKCHAQAGPRLEHLKLLLLSTGQNQIFRRYEVAVEENLPYTVQQLANYNESESRKLLRSRGNEDGDFYT